MATGNFVANVLLAVVLLAPASLAGASGASVAEHFEAEQQVQSRSDTVQSPPVNYKIARTIDGTSEGQGLYLLISIAPEDFVRERMTQLARQLNQDFPDKQKVDVSIFDSETVAKNVIPAGHHYEEFKKAERGVYHLDRAKGSEYIQFSTKPGRPSNEVKVNLGRSRRKRWKTT